MIKDKKKTQKPVRKICGFQEIEKKEGVRREMEQYNPPQWREPFSHSGIDSEGHCT